MMLIFKCLINAVRISNGNTLLCFINFYCISSFWNFLLRFSMFLAFIHLFTTFLQCFSRLFDVQTFGKLLSMFQLVFDPVFTKVLLLFCKVLFVERSSTLPVFISQSLRVACLSCHSTTTTTTSTQIFKFCRGWQLMHAFTEYQLNWQIQSNLP
jgi:hypothetical protein